MPHIQLKEVNHAVPPALPAWQRYFRPPKYTADLSATPSTPPFPRFLENAQWYRSVVRPGESVIPIPTPEPTWSP
ncbi:hypothetical protein B0T14DRAFT_183907 [Immersiella caudata]|uniref:Uncharacterized protein n=1 Tax=Immersiella caudata TaxID=314043 RepID=A0AA39WXP5_9PEZI|nr:hypothetical protein B0T14DRAFT_183907 [Immersiella caudata]